MRVFLKKIRIMYFLHGNTFDRSQIYCKQRYEFMNILEALSKRYQGFKKAKSLIEINLSEI